MELVPTALSETAIWLVRSASESVKLVVSLSSSAAASSSTQMVQFTFESGIPESYMD